MNMYWNAERFKCLIIVDFCFTEEKLSMKNRVKKLYIYTQKVLSGYSKHLKVFVSN